MSILQQPDPVKLVASLLSTERDLIPGVIGALAERYGKTDYVSSILHFDFTTYYRKEMGPDLVRRFITFETLIHPADLPDIKMFTAELEQQSATGMKRRINIDPGYISTGHLLLATGKPYAHRPYLRNGVYADVTLIYRDMSFRPQEWTYPDYREQSMIDMLAGIRKKYLKQLAAARKEKETETAE
ncbi:MAG TPA: DUF4416 family protein [Deltaproteobacteria bacterium]|nr:DUF4416 family protein [Deltaproteobacteria bacterium]